MRARALLIGMALGILGFFHANREDHGIYSIGVGRTEELVWILVFLAAAYLSREPVSAALLMMIGTWHATCLIYYWDENSWF